MELMQREKDVKAMFDAATKAYQQFKGADKIIDTPQKMAAAIAAINAMKDISEKEEKINFLKQWSYTINKYVSKRDCDFYPGEVINVNIDIAHKEALVLTDLDTMDLYHLRQKYGLDEVFEQEFSSRLKSFLFKKTVF